MITWRQSAGASAQAAEALALVTALNNFQAMAWLDGAGKITSANPAFAGLLGRAEGELTGQHHARLGFDIGMGAWNAVLKGAAQSVTAEVTGGDGAQRWIAAQIVPLPAAEGKVTRVAVIAQDVTETETRLEDFAGKAAAIDRAQAVIEFTLDGTVTDANANFLSVMGYRLEEVRGQHHRLFVDPAYAASNDYRHFWEELRAGTFKVAEFKRRAKDGHDVWIQASYNPILGPDGRPVKVVKFATDITEAKLRATDAAGQLQAISRVQAVIEFDVKGIIQTANENFLKTTGYSLAEIQGRHHRMFCERDYAESEEYRKFWQELGAGEFKAAEYRRVAKNGSELWLQASYNPIFGPDGRLMKVVKYATDITDRKNAVSVLADSFGRLAAGDLAARLPDHVRGEFAGFDALRASFNGTMTRLEELVAGIHQAARTIVGDSETIAANAGDLATRSERQAATLEETSAAMQEIANSIRMSADNAKKADDEAAVAASQAENGRAVVANATEAMQRIEDRASQIARIVDVIDSIAFQTNLLALNAGVEAARAGEDGRGFAVVASEVRALAQRTTEAARDIKQLIEASTAEVAQGSTLVARSGEALRSIVETMSGVVGSIAEISAASQEQASSVAAVSHGVNEIDRITQHTAALAEESSASSEELSARAQGLRELVSFFRVKGGENVVELRNEAARAGGGRR